VIKQFTAKHLLKNGEKYRNWQPSRSKAGAGVMKGFDLGLKQDFDVMYFI